MLPVEQPFKTYTGKDGKPLDNGFVYFGQPNENPITAPVPVFWDAAGTIPAAQPIRTVNGYTVRAGTPANVFFSGSYSELVHDSKHRQVFYARNSDEFSIATLVGNFLNNLGLPTGGSFISFIADGPNAVLRNLLDKARERVSIDDYPSLQAALDAISGNEKTGYGANPISLDFLGKTVDFTGTLYWPTNVSPINGGLRSSDGQLVMRNPFLANTTLRGYTEYWPYMKISAKDFHFNCLTILNVYIGAFFSDCDFTGDYAALVLVNSNALWTEYNTFLRCKTASNAAVGAGILLDGNSDGTSIYSTGAGAGTKDGSFGYTKFLSCKTDSTAPAVGLKADFGAVPYNGKFQFDGYARGAGGAAIYVNDANMSHAQIDLNLESFGAASNAISLGPKATFSFNSGRIKSASAQMTMSQDPLATVQNNNIGVEGIVLQDKTGAVVPSGHSVQSTIRTHLLKRLDYFSGEQYMIDTLVGTTVAATGSLESRVPNTGQITLRPNDPRSAQSRNWAWWANGGAFGDIGLYESTTRLDAPAIMRLQVQSGGACFNTTGTWGVLSDARLKENVVDARDYSADLRKLRVVKYSLKSDPSESPNLLGVIAQEVEKVFPTMVSTSVNPETDEEIKQVKTSVLTFMLLKMAQEQAARIDKLEGMLKASD